MLPSDDIVNGIIQGYTVEYFKCDEDGNRLGPTNSTIFLRNPDEVATTELIRKLTIFTWYNVSASAFTSVGSGPFGFKRMLTRTQEDGRSNINIDATVTMLISCLSLSGSYLCVQNKHIEQI